ncbi:hypothetical protein BpHYR1_033558 [Brachionus plicatilis]|uniref:SWIM-type domain-containing protein n=1 Tax=Brachionus plicatilis TaxID=10195 RepID=A0A3M7Q3R5_BRAPC|nr:hypothetical protein BpHYR1_033558 [Brachionus plicatilis]
MIVIKFVVKFEIRKAILFISLIPLNKKSRNNYEFKNCNFLLIITFLKQKTYEKNYLKRYLLVDICKDFVLTTTEDSWATSKCSCCYYLKNYHCYHLIVLAVNQELVTIPTRYISVAIEPKRRLERHKINFFDNILNKQDQYTNKLVATCVGNRLQPIDKIQKLTNFY